MACFFALFLPDLTRLLLPTLSMGWYWKYRPVLLGVTLLLLCISLLLGHARAPRKTDRVLAGFFLVFLLEGIIPLIHSGLLTIDYVMIFSHTAIVLSALRSLASLVVLSIAVVGLFRGKKWAKWALLCCGVLLVSVWLWTPDVRSTLSSLPRDTIQAAKEGGPTHVRSAAVEVKVVSKNWFYVVTTALGLVYTFLLRQRRSVPVAQHGESLPEP